MAVTPEFAMPPSAGSAAFDELRARFGNPSFARVRRLSDDREVGVLTVLFHGPVWSGWWFGSHRMAKTTSLQVTVERGGGAGLDDEDIHEEAEDGWSEQLVKLLAGRYLAKTGSDETSRLEWFGLEWLTGEVRHALAAGLVAQLPARIRSRPSDLG